MYKEDELLEVLADLKKGDKILIPKGSKVKFRKAFDVEFGTRSMLAVEFEGVNYSINELLVRPTETDTLEVLKSLNALLVKNNPNLGVYHHNVFIRTFYKVKAFILGLFGKNKEVPKNDKHVAEIKKLMSDDKFLDLED